MREGIHPNYYQAKVVCNCGNEFVTGSTKEEIHTQVSRKLLRLVVRLTSSTVNMECRQTKLVYCINDFSIRIM